MAENEKSAAAVPAAAGDTVTDKVHTDTANKSGVDPGGSDPQQLNKSEEATKKPAST